MHMRHFVKINIKVFFICILAFLYSGICLAEQKVFWTEANSIFPKIHCVDVSRGYSCTDTVNVENTVLIDLPSNDIPLGIVVDDKNKKIIWTNSLAGTGTIERADFDGSNKEILKSGLDSPTHLAIDLVNDKIYWTTSNSIFRGNLDDDTAEEITNLSGYTANIQGLALDPAAGLLFWSTNISINTELFKSTIDSDINNMSVNNLLTLLNSETMFGLVANQRTSEVNWADSTGWQIQYAGYSDNAPATLYAEASTLGASGLKGVALDYPEENIYYGYEYDAEKFILKASLSGSEASLNAFLTLSGNISALALSCGRYFTTDSDKDGAIDCNDTCPDNSNKILDAGVCGCGLEDIDTDYDGTFDCEDICPEDERKIEEGLCGCGLIEDINADGEEICADNRQLTPNTEIENPPIVEVQEEEILIILEKFVNPTLTLKKKKKKKKNSERISGDKQSVEISATKYKVSYEVQYSITGAKKKDITKLTTKRNELTLRNLPPGNYSLKYRVAINDNGTAVAKTRFSPTAEFSIQ